MPTLREIRGRIKGVKTTQQLTKAMKLVAAAKLRKSQERALQARPYAKKLRELLTELSQSVDTSRFPLLTERKSVENVLFIVISSDRGLCGSFNSALFKVAHQVIDKEYAAYSAAKKFKMITLGRRASEHFAKGGYPIVEKYAALFTGALKYEMAKAIAETVSRLYINGEVDKVVVIHNEFKNAISPNLRTDILLPLKPAGGKKEQKIDYIFEPDAETIVGGLAPLQLTTEIWRMLLESDAAEQAARMTAMDAATSNAKELLRSLTITYNRARQATITKELIEIVSGANALQES
ncbi:MAG: ATP synthase F1 subunit gamma [Chloroherpetonaceae bacterium]|nr:ATP synthase F1 subunit gamma [Chloroherpetonaceae bacterium]